jgi:hypothetical protein
MCSKYFGEFILWIWYTELRVEKEKSLTVPVGLFVSAGAALASDRQEPEIGAHSVAPSS